ncbi:MAG: Trm112 family protein [Thermoplasmata archaeon]
MKKETLNIIACPECKGPLTLVDGVERDGEIFSGKLFCEKCRVYYDIIEGIPVLLPEKGVRYDKRD